MRRVALRASPSAEAEALGIVEVAARDGARTVQGIVPAALVIAMPVRPDPVRIGAPLALPGAAALAGQSRRGRPRAAPDLGVAAIVRAVRLRQAENWSLAAEEVAAGDFGVSRRTLMRTVHELGQDLSWSAFRSAHCAPIDPEDEEDSAPMTTTRRLVVPLAAEAMDALQRLSRAERRDPGQQARLLLERQLALVVPAARPAVTGREDEQRSR